MNNEIALANYKAIQPATNIDLPFIYWLFEEAISYQRKNGFVGWQTYDKEYLRSDVEKGLILKIIQDEEIVCIFSVCYSDSLIWREKEKADAIYLHRIVVHPGHRGGHLFSTVFAWAKLQAAMLKLAYVRMDTWARNLKIIRYYQDYGFQVVEEYTTPDDPDLPDQHRNLAVTLLQYNVNEV